MSVAAVVLGTKLTNDDSVCDIFQDPKFCAPGSLLDRQARIFSFAEGLGGSTVPPQNILPHVHPCAHVAVFFLLKDRRKFV